MYSFNLIMANFKVGSKSLLGKQFFKLLSLKKLSIDKYCSLYPNIINKH